MFIPATQKSWRVVRRGTPSNALEFTQDASVPLDLQEGQVLVKVEAAALNPVYVFQSFFLRAETDNSLQRL